MYSRYNRFWFFNMHVSTYHHTQYPVHNNRRGTNRNSVKYIQWLSLFTTAFRKIREKKRRWKLHSKKVQRTKTVIQKLPLNVLKNKLKLKDDTIVT